jgi:monoamine oxidase
MPTDRRAWDQLKVSLRYRGRPAREFGFWNVLADQLSSEAVNFVSDSVGFGSMTQNWNAVEALQLIYSDFGPEVNYIRFGAGTDRLTVGLAKGFSAAGGEIFCASAVTRVDSGQDGPPEVVLTVRNVRTTQHWQVRARHVILALPRRALELLGQPGSLFEPYPLAETELLELVGSVHRYPAFKLFLAYEEPWWRELGISSGPSVTDLPIRQTYYFGVEETERALLMSSYNDDRTVAYWQGLAWTERDEPTAPRLQVSGEGGPSQVFVAPPEMIRHAQMQLARMHGLDVPTPYLAAYRNWGAPPFGGAWHLWRVNADSVAVGMRMRRPLFEYNVHVCGEAYSGIQAFIEGALTSTELVLQEQLGLPPPDWLPGDYYLGPRSTPSTAASSR